MVGSEGSGGVWSVGEIEGGEWKDRTDPEEEGDQVEKSVGGGARRIGWDSSREIRVRSDYIDRDWVGLIRSVRL